MNKSEKLRLLARATRMDSDADDAEDMKLAECMAELFESAAEAWEMCASNPLEPPGRCAEAIWAMAKQAKDGEKPGFWDDLSKALDEAEAKEAAANGALYPSA
jgi:hypothetical protein